MPTGSITWPRVAGLEEDCILDSDENGSARWVVAGAKAEDLFTMAKANTGWETVNVTGNILLTLRVMLSLTRLCWHLAGT